MKLFFIFFHFLIHLGFTKGYHYPRNEETADAHRGMDTLNAPKMRKIEIDRKNADVCESANGTKVGGQCLFFENKRKNWGDAVTSCKAKGQQLAIITNPIAFNAYMNSNLAGQSFWLGGSDTANEGHFVWLDGSPFVNFPWENGNPDNYGNQDCLRWGWKNSFDDSKCSIGFHYICQLKEPQLPTFTWPYVGDGCCNLSTTPKCLKEGGQCIPRNETCDGDVYLGSNYCDFNKLKSCQCCVPINCDTLNLCKVLNGTCNRTCEGKSVSGEEFCKDSKHCKCCLPEEPEKPHVCPCGQDDNGGCKGQFFPGKWATGHCEKDCSEGTHQLDNHTCNKTGGEDCKCCAKATITSPTTATTTTTTTTTTTPTPTTTITYCDTQRTTICPDWSRCHSDAICIPYNSVYVCKCQIGYAGDGADCGLDTDIDTWPDVGLTCCKVQAHCRADNCPAKPNSGQEDKDYDGIGDACDLVQNNNTGTPPPITTPGPTLECQDVFDASKNIDTDGDGHMDFFDNCPNITNVNQSDTDGDSVGDLCDTNLDADNDGFQDGFDNCLNIGNPEQSDADKDGLGDKCDPDADNDGIPNGKDNCWLVPNPGQEDANNDGVGDACEDDKDGDGCIDSLDICPNNPKISRVNFGNFKNITLSSIQEPPVWILTNGGKEITQNVNSDPAYMYGLHSFSGLDYEGTLFIAKNGDNDNAGFIFGYQSTMKFYAVVWGQQFSQGFQLKKINSKTAPHSLWNTVQNSQVTVVWKDPNFVPWDYDTSYRWQLIHRPHIGLIRFRILTGSTIITDSGNIYDQDILGGRVGVFCQSQELITWSGIDYSCNDDSVPQEVYDSLPADKQSNLAVNPYKSWAGTVQLGNTTIIP